MRTDLRFRAADGSELPMAVFEPGSEPQAAIVLFHGGGLRAGSIEEVIPHCRALAERGILAASAGRRFVGQGAVRIEDCIEDARRAIEAFITVAAGHGLGTVASGGCSAGAHLALVSSQPAVASGAGAVVAVNPAGTDLRIYQPDRQQRLEVEVGIAPGHLLDYSLINLVRTGNLPTLTLHGTQDEVEPIECVSRFRDAMVDSGNDCVLSEYEGARHAFYQPGGGHFDDVIDRTTEFLLIRLR